MFMQTVHLMPQGHVPLPESLLQARHWDVGQEFLLMMVDDGMLLKPKPHFESTTLDEVAGCLPYSGTPKTLVEMENAVAKTTVQAIESAVAHLSRHELMRFRAWLSAFATERREQEIQHDLADDWWNFLHNIVVPSVEDVFSERGIELYGISPEMRLYHQEERCGIDEVGIGLLAIGNQHAVLMTVRTQPNREDIDEHLEHLGMFKRYFPEYAERKLIGAVAGIVIDEGVDRYAYQQGLFVIGQRGDTVRLLNDENFQPKEW